jgi:hypothetical protein
MTADTHVHDGCDACDGFVQRLSRPLPPPCPSGNPSEGVVDPIGEHATNPSYLSYPSSVQSLDVMAPSYPSLVRGSGVTAPIPPVMEARAEDALERGDWVWLVSADGVQQHVRSYQIHAIALGPDGHRYARFAETSAGWPLAQCARADPPHPMQPPPCAVCGGTARWDHASVWRCVTCWPLESPRTYARGDAATSAPGTTRSDPP